MRTYRIPRVLHCGDYSGKVYPALLYHARELLTLWGLRYPEYLSAVSVVLYLDDTIARQLSRYDLFYSMDYTRNRWYLFDYLSRTQMRVVLEHSVSICYSEDPHCVTKLLDTYAFSTEDITSVYHQTLHLCLNPRRQSRKNYNNFMNHPRVFIALRNKKIR